MRARYIDQLLLTLVMHICLGVSHLSAEVDFNTVHGKVMAGYQGWHWVEGDGSSANIWHQWSSVYPDGAHEVPGPGTARFEIYPDLSEYEKTYDTDFYRNGKRFQLFSAQDYSTVDTHFRWMKEYNIDGAFVQRFLNMATTPGAARAPNVLKVLENCKNAAEAHGRAYVVMYDVGKTQKVPDEVLLERISGDWLSLNANGYVDSSNYLHHEGKPVVSIWGMGFNDRTPVDPARAQAVVDWFKNTAGCFVMGGVPENWRTLDGASRTDPAWLTVYESFDIISPWMVNRVKTPAESDAWLPRTTADVQHAQSVNGRYYMPVVFPGFSWSNWHEPPGPFNEVPRLGGQFMWRQAFNGKRAGADMIYLAMFDEVDEGTSIYKMAETFEDCPDTFNWVTADVDGFKLPGDWYLQVSGAIKDMMVGKTSTVGRLPIYDPVTVTGAPEGDVGTEPFWLTLTAIANPSYYALNEGDFIQISQGNPVTLLINEATMLKTYGSAPWGTTNVKRRFFDVDSVMPNIAISAGPSSDIISADPVNITLEVNEDYGYWSVNGEPYNQIELDQVVQNANSGFEEGFSSSANYWTQAVDHFWSSARSRNGTKSLRSTYRGPQGRASKSVVNVTPNTHYTLSAWIWKDDNNGAAYVDMSDVEGEASPIVRNGDGGGQWTYVSAPWYSASLNQIEIRCVQDGGNISGDMFWDDVQLTKVSSTVSKTITINETSTLSYYAEDVAGNRTEIKTLSIIISDGSDQYEYWRNSIFEIPADRNTARTEDYDGDGKSNEYEYMFGMDPQDNKNEILRDPYFNSENNDFTITFNKRNDGTVSQYLIETSSDLINWNTESESQLSLLASDTLGDIDTVTYRYNPGLSGASNGKLFFRIRAIE